MVPPPSQNSVGVCNQITLLILYYISSRLVILLKITDAPKQVSDIFNLLLSSSSILAFRYSFFLFLKCPVASRLTLFRLSTLLLFGSCNHRILSSFLRPKNCENSSPNHVLCFLNSYRPRLSLSEILIFSLLYSHDLHMPLLTFNFSKAANLFKTIIWHCFLISSSFSFLTLNSPHQTSVLHLYYCQSFPNFCNHQTVISITVSSPVISYTQYTPVPSAIYQYVISLVVFFPSGQSMCTYEIGAEHRALNSWMFWMWQTLLFLYHYHFYPDIDSHSQLSIWKCPLPPILH